jgi:Trypsin-like peptidase domain
MADNQKLMNLSVDDLLQELKAREAKAENVLPIITEPSENLREFDDVSIIKTLKENQKVIYGTDDRIDIFNLPVGANRNDVDSVVALCNNTDLSDNGNGTSTLQTQIFGTARNLCAGEPFRDQPIGCFCSGFLVATDIIATAGHCVNNGNVANVRFIFGFRMRNATTAETIFSNGEIYSGVTIIGRQEVGNGPDWALVRIDRPVTNHPVVRIRSSGKIVDSQGVHVIGHPSGLPAKFAGGAVVRDNQSKAFFVANLDTYGGNSGSPVFNSDTHEVEGILVRGENDFVMNGSCRISLVCPTTGCRGEDCTRTTEFALYVAPSAQGDDMQPGEVLNSNQSITSANGRYRFIYQSDGNLVLYDGGVALWASNTDGRPVGICIMQTDGNLVIYTPDNQAIWASNTDGRPGSRLIVQDDGNVVIYQPDGSAAWATNTVQP